MPVGVWEVRESVRKALEKKPESFTTFKDAIKHIDSKLTIPIENYIKRSKILSQKRIIDFL